MSQKILVIDDVKNERELMKRHLEQAGYEVIEAASGEEGINMVEGHKPDIVVTDTKMTGIDGFETCKRIKEIDNNTKVIILTGNAEVFDEVKAKYAESDAYTVKGTNFAALREALSRMVVEQAELE